MQIYDVCISNEGLRMLLRQIKTFPPVSAKA